jgi:hypothetical protein
MAVNLLKTRVRRAVPWNKNKSISFEEDVFIQPHLKNWFSFNSFKKLISI